MLHLDDPGLDATTARGLRDYQRKVDNAGSYPEQVATGKHLFERYKHRTNRVFKVVRTRLADMCPGARRCGYCEDSVGNEVEHIKPKDLYPERVFVWENYLLACGQCNRAKSNRFSVISRGRLRDVTRRRNAPVRRPRAGAPALINPRDEDPLAFFDLEITETFVFLPRLDLSGIDEQRAHYTIDTLKLNRDVLLTARRAAYGAYRALLFEYRQRRDDGASGTALGISNAIMTSAHPTVWREMQRQRSLVGELRDLFSDVPEALSW